jgi:multicomponent K+:H+ antiporter subunit E
MKKRVPPVLALVMLLMWLLLNSSVSLGHIVLGAIISAVLLAAGYPLRPLQPKLHHGTVLIRLFFHVLVDVLRSNLGVARVVLGLTGRRHVTSGFIDIPLDIRDPHGLAVLAMIITSTPGTVWVDVSVDKATLTIHVLDLRDETEWVHRIKSRYERPLIEVFE